MAKKNRDEDITKWLNRIKHSEKIRDEADEKYGYNRAILEYKNDFASAMPSFIANTDIIPINEVYGFIKTFIPSVYSRDPYLTVNPKGAKSIAGAKISELSLNAYWRELRLKREVKRCIFDAIVAEGWIKTGYSAVLGYAEKEEGKPGVEVNEFIKEEEIFASRVSWRNMVRDPDAINGIHDARWVAQNIIKPLDAVQESSTLENTGDLKPSFVASYRDDKSKLDYYNNDTPYVSMWEIWDRDTEKVFVISEGHDKYLVNKKWPYDLEGFPYVLLRFNENPDDCYAPNLIAAWEPQLWEKIKIRSMQMDHLKRFNRQLFIEEGSMVKSEMDKFTRGQTGAVISIKKSKNPPAPIQYPAVQSDMYAIESRIDLDKDNISGQPNAVRSAPQRTQSRTLGEIDRLISSFQSRQTEPQSIVEDFSAEVGYKLLKLMMQFLTVPKYVRATLEDVQTIQEAFIDPMTGASRFDGTGFTFTKEDIQGIEFEIDVKSGSTLPLDRQNRTEAMISMLKLGPTIGIQPGDKVSKVIGKNLLSEFELKEVEQAYKEALNEMEVQEQLMDAERGLQLQANKETINRMAKQGNGAMP